jgi:hypothetical protein
MNGSSKKAWLAGLGLAALAGCGHKCGYKGYEDFVNPCWPEVYSHVARQETVAPFAAQANNGLILEQTVWNEHFRPGTNQLGNAGLSLLDRLARRRPQPMAELFLQTSHDLAYDAAKPAEFGKARQDLDAQRVKAIMDYVAAVRPDVPFRVTVIDPSPVGVNAREALRAIESMQNSATGALPTSNSGTSSDGSSQNGSQNSSSSSSNNSSSSSGQRQ